MTHKAVRSASLGLLLGALAAIPLTAQDRLKTYPGYDRYSKLAPQLRDAVRAGALQVSWKDAKTFEYTWDGKVHVYDAGTRTATVVGDPPAAQTGRGGRGGRPERGRQFDSAESPDKTRRAFYRDRNLWIGDLPAGGGATSRSGAQGPPRGEEPGGVQGSPPQINERQVTTDGSEKDRIKYGTASWVYGEELGQVTAMWWSPDSKKLAYYRFDEKQVPDYFLQLDQTKLQSKVDTEAYPKAGAPNPAVELFVYDLATGKTTRVDVRDGKPFDNDVVGHYVYAVRWSPAGDEILFNRTNRRQQIMELVAADPVTGEARVVVREEWRTGWAENRPLMRFLADGKRFIWESARTGWNNFYLYDLSGTLIAPLTSHGAAEVNSLVKVDEAAGVLFYTANDGDSPLKSQLHRVRLDGRGDVRLTDLAFHHTVASCLPPSPPAEASARQVVPSNCGISPDNKYFVDVYQTHNTPAATRLVDATTGKVVSEIVKSDTTKADALGVKRAERFTYTAADGTTPLYGLIRFPSNFDPSKKYPALAFVYGGPEGAPVSESFAMPNALTEYGFLVLSLESRAVPGRGRRQLDSLYLKLGQTEMDDMAAGVRALWTRPYFDKDRVGVTGTSYGGYSAIMLLLKHPDAFAAAVASSPVTAWDHYDTIYTERYMWIPQENNEGYIAGSAMPLAKNLEGRLMLYWGTADNNVHPSNMMQFIAALQQAGKSFEVQVGPDRGHTGLNQDRMMEFFIENLVLRPAASATSMQ
ncbi:MAG: DPP IV N-terminal domain-containing protein [Vicinamibacterales bacterium]